MNGRMQSPILLNESESSFNSTINLLFDTYNIINYAKLKFDERILYVSHNQEGESLGYVTLSRNGNLKKYALKRIEFIYPGEHKFGNQTTDLEIKFIHEQIMFFEFDVNQYRRLADSNTNLVVSILYNSNSLVSDNGFLTELLGTYNGNGKQVLSLEDYGLLRDRQFFFYEGSFSFNPCNENVNNIVYNKAFYIKSEQRAQINSMFNSKYVNGNTAKDLAQLYGRKVYRNYAFPNELSSGYIKSFAFFIIFLILL
jgi:carbonic anhydrase